jgi:hypothetical protein
METIYSASLSIKQNTLSAQFVYNVGFDLRVNNIILLVFVM